MIENNINNTLVVQSNSLIMAHYSLSVNEEKIILYLIACVGKLDTGFKCIRINLTKFQKLLGLKSTKNHKAIRELTLRLQKRPLQIMNNGSLLQLNWLASAEYKNGYVELEISEKLKPYLLNLSKNFTIYQLQIILSLKSFYSIRFYGFLKQYESVGERTMDIADLREMLMIEKGKYSNYANFKQKIIMVAKKELSEKTDIEFDFSEIKEHRKVVRVKFTIKQNKRKRDLLLPEIDFNDELLDKMKNYYCLTEKQSEDILGEYDKSYIERVLAYVEREFKKGIIKNIGAYTLKAIKENYCEQKSLFGKEIDKRKEDQKLQQQHEKKRQAIKKDREQLDFDYDKYKSDLAQKYIGNLSSDKLKKLKTKSIERAKEKFPSLINNARIFDKDSTFVKMAMESEILKEITVLSYNEFFEKNKEKYKNIGLDLSL